MRAERAFRRDEGAARRLLLIDVPDLDAALSWAKRHPAAAYGAIEVRPVWA
ncbi:MAG: YciI family protein [Candidatus Binatia bacterium]